MAYARSRLAAYSHVARSVVRRFAADPSGATAIEYSLIATLIGAVILTALTTIGTQINVMISAVIPALQ